MIRSPHAHSLLSQAAHRGSEIRKRIAEKSAEEAAAAVKLQALARGKKARAEVESLHDEKNAATSMQSIFRGKKARKKVAAKKEKGAATRMQSIFRRTASMSATPRPGSCWSQPRLKHIFPERQCEIDLQARGKK